MNDCAAKDCLMTAKWLCFMSWSHLGGRCPAEAVASRLAWQVEILQTRKNRLPRGKLSCQIRQSPRLWHSHILVAAGRARRQSGAKACHFSATCVARRGFNDTILKPCLSARLPAGFAAGRSVRLTSASTNSDSDSDRTGLDCRSSSLGNVSSK